MRLRDRADRSEVVARLAREYVELRRRAGMIRDAGEVGGWNDQLASLVSRAHAEGVTLDDLRPD